MLRLFALAVLCFTTFAHAQTLPGIDVLEQNDFAQLEGKRVGLVANPASRSLDLRHTADVLRDGGVNLVGLYGPEHGVFGDVYAGDKIESATDKRTGLPIYSLYGATRVPNAEMLEPIDVMLYDLQDIGSRSYTYISTLEAVIEGMAAADKPLIVLDRPNPLGGNRVEGGLVSEGYESFVSAIDVPYVHGMTVGELAQLIAKRNAPDWDGLSVIKMENWKRDMVWEDTGMKWTPTSPHIPHASSVWGYAATGVIGELYQVSNGVGYTLPFEIVGDPDIDADDLAATLNEQLATDGVKFIPIHFKPFYSTHKGELCHGVQLIVDPKTEANLYELNFRILAALDAKGIFAAAEKRHGMFDKVTGSDRLRKLLSSDGDLDKQLEAERTAAAEFRDTRADHLLYE